MNSVKRIIRAGSVIALLLLIDGSMRVLGYKRTARLLLRCAPTPPADRADLTRALQVARTVHRGAAITHANCLRRSLALWWLLRWYRLPSQIQIGFNQDAGHAWVEHHNFVINDRSNIADNYRIRYGADLTPERVAKIV